VEEHHYELQVFEDLLDELELQLIEIMNIDKSEQRWTELSTFWEKTWPDGVIETHHTLEDRVLTDQEKVAVEEVGVVWKEPIGPQLQDDEIITWSTRGLSYYFAKLEEIGVE